MLDEVAVPSAVSAESIKIMGESIGISPLGDDVARELAEDITYRLKNIVQDGKKFTHHGKRKRFTCEDFDWALKSKNIEPIYGVVSSEFIPWRLTSGGGRDLHFLEDRELEVSDIVTQQLPKLPPAAAVKCHWLAIEGVQPAIPENPAPMSKNLQKQEAVDPASKLAAAQADTRNTRNIHGRGLKSVETVRVKQLATHELSAEQQLYYKEITEACVGSDEPKRGEALHSLAFDPGLHQMVARLCTFIAEGVRVNVVQRNLALLIYLMRMTKALLDNNTLYLEKYLHELTPSVLTCIVSRQLCLKPDMDNHWALRDFAARLMSQICRHYNTTTNGLQTRISRVFCKCLNVDKTPLATVYGAVAGLCELGPEVIKALVVPKLRVLSNKIEQCIESPSAYEKNAAVHIKGMLVKSVPPVLKMNRNPPDLLTDYKNDFGFLGPLLQASVIKLRQTPGVGGVVVSAPALAPTLRPLSTPTPTRILHQSVGGVGGRALVVGSGGQVTTTGGVGVAPSPGQKLIIMTSRTPGVQQGLDSPQLVSAQLPLGEGSGATILSPTSTAAGAALPPGAKYVLVKTEPTDDEYGM
ncbi:transcription initiation factor TFIID subunit 6-like [Hyalella azteca]|uniref:Transcription initiation factor TFIID subunit 6 n=1 Tax=Hyalella azteca TaxID=294128 RepID=A0A8B7P0Y1_HYAAZ|nr:transcription initiation factor TFIID subunit 6-like [Hyalella azteca]